MAAKCEMRKWLGLRPISNFKVVLPEGKELSYGVQIIWEQRPTSNMPSSDKCLPAEKLRDVTARRNSGELHEECSGCGYWVSTVYSKNPSS